MLALIEFLNRLMSLIERFVKWSRDANNAAWLDELEKTMDQLEKAETPEQKRAAARALLHSIRTLRD